MRASETVQYFQFDSEGNMFIFLAGSGINGVPKMVKPGNEMIFNENVDDLDISDTQESGFCSMKSVKSDAVSQQSSISSSTKCIPTKCGFHQPLKDKELEDLSLKNFAPDTMKKVKWAVDMFRNWRNYCHSHNNSFDFIQCDLDDKSSITHNLIFALVIFLTEVKKVDGSEFSGKTLYNILICLQFHLEAMGFGWKLLDEAMFRDVRLTLDNLMKLCTAQGLGTSVKQAQFLESSDENCLWDLGLLGTSNPNQLLNTLVFMIGKGFALCAGKERHKLRAPLFNSQFRFIMDNDGETFIRYTEDIGLKMNKGGIKQRKLLPKQVDVCFLLVTKHAVLLQ